MCLAAATWNHFESGHVEISATESADLPSMKSLLSLVASGLKRSEGLSRSAIMTNLVV